MQQRAAVVQFAGQRNEEGKWDAIFHDKEIGLRNSTEMGKLKVRPVRPLKNPHLYSNSIEMRQLTEQNVTYLVFRRPCFVM